MVNTNELIQLVDMEFSHKVEIDEYQSIELFINDYTTMSAILKELKFKRIGNVYDYPEILSKPENLRMSQVLSDYEWVEALAISPKYNAVMNYSKEYYCIRCIIVVDNRKLKKFMKKIKEYISNDSKINPFKDVNFPTHKGEYLEVSNTSDEEKRPLDVYTKKLDNSEKLIFDEESPIVEVLGDINMFFGKKSTEMYKKLDIPYKRGVILYGDPGNGKSAMIREVIRTLDDVIKIIINPGIENFTSVMSDLFEVLDGRKAIIILEDIETIISCCNRSELLNVLDGVNIKSGIYLIGTTNYPERIDPAFINRSGRFDKSYKITNPSDNFRRLFFKNRDLLSVFNSHKIFKDKDVVDSENDIIELFVQNSNGLPMANLKELITSTCYAIAINPDLTLEEAITETYNRLKTDRETHIKSVENTLDD